MSSPTFRFSRIGPGFYTRSTRALDWIVRKDRDPRPGRREPSPWRIILNGRHYDRADTLTEARRIILRKEQRQ